MLEKYKSMRNFSATPEPVGKAKPGKDNLFVIQRHEATRLHYDFRIEYEGVLKSWAVPKGLPKGDEKRLAVQTEDHPLEYADFSGIIPKGEYGGGKVEIWDRGKYENVSMRSGQKITVQQAMDKGHIQMVLKGKKAKGRFHLIKTGKNWLMMKSKSEETLDVEITRPEKIIFPKKNYSKKDFVDYYIAISDYMLPHIMDRPVSMQRFPHGVNGEIFFQKNVPDFFPKWIKTKLVESKREKTNYAVCNDKRTLAYLANLVMVPHIWLSRIDKLDYPDKLIFDIDPQDESTKYVIAAAKAIREILSDISIESYLMSTGSRGLHVTVPLDRKLRYDKVSSFARVIANHLENSDPEKFTAEHRKDKRKGKVFIDTYRNGHAQTAACPYSVRINENAGVAAPMEWKELTGFEPQKFDIKNMPKRVAKVGDIWSEIYENKQSLRKALG